VTLCAHPSCLVVVFHGGDLALRINDPARQFFHVSRHQKSLRVRWCRQCGSIKIGPRWAFPDDVAKKTTRVRAGGRMKSLS
jgi:hypothetical protein